MWDFLHGQLLTGGDYHCAFLLYGLLVKILLYVARFIIKVQAVSAEVPADAASRRSCQQELLIKHHTSENSKVLALKAATAPPSRHQTRTANSAAIVCTAHLPCLLW
jgi:hypothetical protein